MRPGSPMRMIRRSFAVSALEARETAKLVDHVEAQLLSVVHDQEGLPSAGVCFQVSGEGVAERLAGSVLRVPHAELLADGGQQLLGAEARD